jgi:acyl-CoA thioesterase FadM
MMDRSIHSQYISPVGWDQVLVSHTSISQGGPRVLIYDTTFWAQFDPHKMELACTAKTRTAQPQ